MGLNLDLTTGDAISSNLHDLHVHSSYFQLLQTSELFNFQLHKAARLPALVFSGFQTSSDSSLPNKRAPMLRCPSGVVVVQVKPQLEELLKLPVDLAMSLGLGSRGFLFQRSIRKNG